MVGIAAIKSAMGVDKPFYDYRCGTLVHSAADVYARHEVLYLSHDLTGYVEFCSRFYLPGYQSGGNRTLLSKSCSCSPLSPVPIETPRIR